MVEDSQTFPAKTKTFAEKFNEGPTVSSEKKEIAEIKAELAKVGKQVKEMRVARDKALNELNKTKKKGDPADIDYKERMLGIKEHELIRKQSS